MKKLKWLCLVVAAVMGIALFAACSEDEPKEQTYTVTYYDGSSVLKTEEVKENGKATEWTPEKSGYNFGGWYATPNFQFKYDFEKAITENTSVFAQFASASATVDSRSYYIVGSGTSPILRASNWGKVFDSTTKMTKASDKNEYTYTLDVYKDDLFQFAINESWHNQRGVGYLESFKLADGTVAFSGASTIGDNSAYRLNIKCEYAGNYTFTLTTHPDDDQYETSHPSYTEANKEAFNINPLDKISWVRNGDVSDNVNVVTDFYIKGSGVTDWKDMYNAATKMTNDNGVYTLSVYLKANEEFLFTSRNTIGTEVSTGTEYLRASNLDEASKAYVDQKPSSNMVAKASGTYTFTYTASTKVLSVAFEADKAPAAADYYIDGTFAEGVEDWKGYCFNADYKLTEKTAGSGIYEIKGVSLKANSQIIIQAFKAGSTERGEWGTEGYNGLGSYNVTYLLNGGKDFSAVDAQNNNIKVLTAGTYNITFNSYAKIISIENANSVDDAYIVGTMTGEGGWKVSSEWKMTLGENNIYTIEVELAADDSFGVRVMQGETTTQRYWFGASAVTGSPEGFDVSASNITCKTAGTYVITCTVTDGTGTVTISSKN